MKVMQIGGRPECVCGSRALDVQVAATWPDWNDYEMTCCMCGSKFLYREPESVAEVLGSEKWADD